MLQLSCESGAFELNSVFFEKQQNPIGKLPASDYKVRFRQLGKYSSMSQVFTGLGSP